MRKRRNPRRPLRSATPGQINNGPRRQLHRAHQLMESGHHADAAFIFERLARGAHDRGFLRHVPFLYLQAARANLLAGNPENGKSLLFESLNIFAAAQRWPALARTGQRVIEELRQLGYEPIAEEIDQWLAKTLPESLESYTEGQKLLPSLPIKCPFCGGVLRPGEIEMLDQITGECPYCGSAVRGDE
jgi:hypothetical protein